MCAGAGAVAVGVVVDVVDVDGLVLCVVQW